MRARLEQLGALLGVAALVGAFFVLILSVPWSLAICIIAFAFAAAGYVWGRYCGREQAAEAMRGWEGYADVLERELLQMCAERDKALEVNAQLNRNIPVVYDAGIVAGQTLQVDRERWGL